jgi:hypothetical protein
VLSMIRSLTSVWYHMNVALEKKNTNVTAVAPQLDLFHSGHTAYIVFLNSTQLQLCTILTQRRLSIKLSSLLGSLKTWSITGTYF